MIKYISLLECHRPKSLLNLNWQRKHCVLSALQIMKIWGGVQAPLMVLVLRAVHMFPQYLIDSSQVILLLVKRFPTFVRVERTASLRAKTARLRVKIARHVAIK